MDTLIFTNSIRVLVASLALLFAVGAGTGSAAGPGEWTVRVAPGGHLATWTSPDPLPTGSARPEIRLDGQTLGPATVSADGREVSILVPGAERPDADRLDVRLSGQDLDNPAVGPAPPSAPPLIAPAGTPAKLDFDPGVRGDLPIRIFEYRQPSFRYAGLRRKLEVQGHVVAPADPSVAAGSPLVLFLHGRHSACYRSGSLPWAGGNWPCPRATKPTPSLRGYDYLQRTLASQGFVTVSIAANAINGQDHTAPDGGARARATLVRHHLNLWASWVGTGRRAADLDRVVLVGHSRGGEGVNRAAEEIPVAAPYRIVGQVLLAPTNFARQTAAYVPTVTVLPYCDGDVSDLQGQAYTDDSIGLAVGDISIKSSVTMFGANHNFFNTEWTPGRSVALSDDDSVAPEHSLCGSRGSTRLTAGQQRRVARSYVAGAIQVMAGTDQRPAVLFDGSRVRVGPVDRARVISQSVGGGKLTLVPGRGLKLAGGNRPGVRICPGYAGGNSVLNCGAFADPEITPHWPGTVPPGRPTRPALALGWKIPGRTARLETGRDLDLTGRSSLDLRVVVDPGTRATRLGVTLTDANGNSLTLSPNGDGRVDAMPRDRGLNPATPGRYLARTLRVPLPTDGADPIDLGRIREVALTGRSKPDCGSGCPAASRVWILDVSARSSGPIPSAPDTRLPLIRLKPVIRREGDADRQLVRVPFEITGEITDPHARIRVVVGGDLDRSAPRPFDLILQPGQRTGSIPIRYRGNRVANLARTISVTGYPLRGVTPWPGEARLRLRDDDPKPRLLVRRLDRSVRAGRPARWRVELTEPIGWDATIEARFARTPGLSRMTLRDLPGRWVRNRLFGAEQLPPDTALTNRNLWFYHSISRATGRTTITIPTVQRGSRVARGIRLRLKVTGFPSRLTAPVRVLPG